MKEYLDITYDDLGNKLDLYTPDSSNFSTLIYIHGGGLVEGDKSQDNYKEMASSFTKSGYAFASLNYRLYPQVKYPGYILDVIDGINYLYDHIDEYGGNKSFIISGQSAGAYIALMISVNIEFNQMLKFDYDVIKGWIFDSAQTTTHFRILEKEYGIDPYAERIDKCAPIYYLDKNTRLDNALFIVYENDIIKRKEQNILFNETLKYFKNEANVSFLTLKGGHCNGSINKDSDNEYEYVKVVLSWLDKK